MGYRTEQEQFWAEEFGDDYIERNSRISQVASNTALFSKVFTRVDHIKSIMELGANIGQNIAAMQAIFPNADYTAVEINRKATEILKNKPGVNVICSSILDLGLQDQYDFVLTKGVLIHIAPDNLKDVYDTLYRLSTRFICIAEYYSPVPVSIDYRGHTNRLFKRDFAGEIIDQYSNIRLVDYGFVYHRDNNFPQDDLNWFLLEKVD